MSETIHHVSYPTRDEDRRRICRLMLGISKKAENSFTVEELEEVCIKRGYLHRVKE